MKKYKSKLEVWTFIKMLASKMQQLQKLLPPPAPARTHLSTLLGRRNMKCSHFTKVLNFGRKSNTGHLWTPQPWSSPRPRRRPRLFNIVMSRQFCTLVMFYISLFKPGTKGGSLQYEMFCVSRLARKTLVSWHRRNCKTTAETVKLKHSHGQKGKVWAMVFFSGRKNSSSPSINGRIRSSWLRAAVGGLS